MRYLVSGLAVVAALVFIAASGAMNFMFMRGQGLSETEGHILGAVSIAVTMLCACLPFLISSAWSRRKFLFVTIASAVFALCLGFSLLSAFGFAASNRGAVTGDRETLALRLKAVEKDLSEAEAKHAAFANARPAGVIEQALNGIRQDRKWSASKGCEDATAQDSRAFCKSYFDIKAELAGSVEAARLSGAVDGYKREAVRLREAGAGRDADPQAGLVSRLFRLDVSAAQTALIVFIAVLVELGAAFGLYLATGHFEEKPRRQRAGDVEVMPPTSAPMRNVTPLPPAGGAVALTRKRLSVGDDGGWQVSS